VVVLLLARRVLVQVRSGLILGLKALPGVFQTLVARIRKWRSERVAKVTVGKVEKEEIQFAEPPVRPQVSEVSLGEPDRGDLPQSPAITLPPAISKASSGKRAPHTLPSLSLLEDPPPALSGVAREELTQRSALLEEKLRDYGVEGRILQVLHGPVVTMFEFSPASGVKVSKISNLSDDLALAMRALAVRIVAPIPGKAVVGIEIPNSVRQPVALKEILASEEFNSQQGRLPLALGKDILGRPVITDLAQIPHLLIAGATGSGKSVGINAMVCSLLFHVSPEEAKFLMIDPKMLELSVYEGIPHLLAPVVTNPKRAALALRGVIEEMERRYALLASKGVRNIAGYNTLIATQKSETPEEEGPLPYIVVVIDELADLMMVSSRDVEDSLTRLAQMARAAGIHLLVATQRPSVDVLTGLIKANFPARISFQVSSKTDSRTILDANGAERLLGRGDMLFLPPGTSHLARIHGAFVSEQEISRVTKFLKKQGEPVYDDSLFLPTEQAHEEEVEVEDDEKYQEAVELVARSRQASISMVQRRLRVGYNRAARMIERMEKEGLVSPSDGVKPREVYVTPKEA
jgi:S-DNA-T family DNA segregation ATPase FtsK/SpoIIIE